MIPNLTTEQRRENLEKAKAARQRRHAILKALPMALTACPTCSTWLALMTPWRE